MGGLRLFNSTKGIFNAMKYEISKEAGAETNLNSKEDKGIDEATINKIIELSEK